jgi:Protein-tyrosine phosphatase
MFYFIFSDGRSRAGVYCAANACIEQVIQHGEVDIFQAVKTVRRHRPQLVDNMVSVLLSFHSDSMRIFENFVEEKDAYLTKKLLVSDYFQKFFFLFSGVNLEISKFWVHKICLQSEIAIS